MTLSKRKRPSGYGGIIHLRPVRRQTEMYARILWSVRWPASHGAPSDAGGPHTAPRERAGTRPDGAFRPFKESPVARRIRIALPRPNNPGAALNPGTP